MVVGSVLVAESPGFLEDQLVAAPQMKSQTGSESGPLASSVLASYLGREPRNQDRWVLGEGSLAARPCHAHMEAFQVRLCLEEGQASRLAAGMAGTGHQLVVGVERTCRAGFDPLMFAVSFLASLVLGYAEIHSSLVVMQNLPVDVACLGAESLASGSSC